VTIAYAELFTPSRLKDLDEGRAFVQALTTRVPYWTPDRYGWSEPLRHRFNGELTGERFEHFWGQIGYWRNAARTLNALLDVRTGPFDILSPVRMYGPFGPELKGDGLGAFLADCGAAPALDITYAMVHVFTEQEHGAYYRNWFALPPVPDSVKGAAQGTMPYFLRDLYWANLFGPPYVELFGVDRLRTAPAAVAREVRPGYFYLQLTDDIADRDGIDAVRERVKEHIGEDCFYDAAATTPRRAPVFTTAAEDGLWKPVKGTYWTGELKALWEKAQSGEKPQHDGS
jgi:hypothetical protein